MLKRSSPVKTSGPEGKHVIRSFGSLEEPTFSNGTVNARFASSMMNYPDAFGVQTKWQIGCEGGSFAKKHGHNFPTCAILITNDDYFICLDLPKNTTLGAKSTACWKKRGMAWSKRSGLSSLKRPRTRMAILTETGRT